MQKLIISTIIGVVIGVLLGASIVAPRLTGPEKPSETAQNSVTEVAPIESTTVTEILHPEPTFLAEKSKQPIQGDVHWRMASAFDMDMPVMGALARKLETDINIISGGEISIKHHAPGTISPVSEMFQAVKSGAIDAAFSTPLIDMEHNISLSLFGAQPFGPEFDELLAWFYAGGGQEKFENIYHALGMHAEVCGLIPAKPAGWFKKEINSVEDFKGLKIHIKGLAARTVEKLGALTVELDTNKIHKALKNGGIHAASYSLPSIDYIYQLHKAALYYYFPGWHQRATFINLLVRHDTWTGLSEKHRQQLKTVCGNNTLQGIVLGEAGQFDALKVFSAHGVKISDFPPEILKALEDAWQDVASEQSALNKEFRHIWKSLSLFRRDYDIWNDLNSM